MASQIKSIVARQSIEDIDDDELAAIWANIVYLMILDNIFSVVVAVLVLYDFTITLYKERLYVWNHKSKFSGGTLVYFINRYLMLFVVFIGLSSLAYTTDRSCHIAAWPSTILLLIVQVSQSVFSALRLHAIWGGNAKVGLSTFAVHCVPLGIRIFIVAQPWEALSNSLLTDGAVGGCVISQEVSFGFDIMKVILVFNVANIIAYLWSLALTIMKTYQLSKDARAVKFSVSTSTLLLKDGSLQFTALTVLCIYEAVWAVTRGTDSMYSLVIALSSVLISNFVLNLRQVYLPDPVETQSSAIFASFSTFATNVIGNLGAPLGANSTDVVALKSPNPLAVDLDVPWMERKKEVAPLLREEYTNQGRNRGQRIDIMEMENYRPSDTELTSPESVVSSRWR
ncbi:hypothetical protein BXZ70DRAFT_940940 [Cristinia sonorae]|uniref:DUF6533 domain-containing protein n=1 Tax=Cristinia sonorae TaxID=1940300 RepID=A0A8K0UM29_9AGAR|nr:hypothetical protein BXZ70DRAFT_940940 [Cristinia sonorae]